MAQDKIKRYKIATVIIITLVCLLVPFSQVLANQRVVSNEAEEHIISQLRRAGIPNAAVAVIHNGETSYIFHNSQQDTLFQIGSLSKSFTAFGVLLLEDMGLLSVTDPVNLSSRKFTYRIVDGG